MSLSATAIAIEIGKRGRLLNCVSQAADGQLLPQLPRPLRMAEKALTAVILETNIQGISTLPIHDLLKAMV